MAEPFTASDYAAWYAAFLATLGIIFHILGYFRDRPKIRVRGRAGISPESPLDPVNPYKAHILISVVNTGRRPITITEVGVQMKKGSLKYWMATDSSESGPREIQEGRVDEFWLDQTNVDLSNARYVYAIDAKGKEYRGKLIV